MTKLGQVSTLIANQTRQNDLLNKKISGQEEYMAYLAEALRASPGQKTSGETSRLPFLRAGPKPEVTERSRDQRSAFQEESKTGRFWNESVKVSDRYSPFRIRSRDLPSINASRNPSLSRGHRVDLSNGIHSGRSGNKLQKSQVRKKDQRSPCFRYPPESIEQRFGLKSQLSALKLLVRQDPAGQTSRETLCIPKRLDKSRDISSKKVGDKSLFFAHPALSRSPKPFRIDFSKNLPLNPAKKGGISQFKTAKKTNFLASKVFQRLPALKLATRLPLERGVAASPLEDHVGLLHLLEDDSQSSLRPANVQPSAKINCSSIHGRSRRTTEPPGELESDRLYRPACYLEDSSASQSQLKGDCLEPTQSKQVEASLSGDKLEGSSFKPVQKFSDIVGSKLPSRTFSGAEPQMQISVGLGATSGDAKQLIMTGKAAPTGEAADCSDASAKDLQRSIQIDVPVSLRCLTPCHGLDQDITPIASSQYPRKMNLEHHASPLEYQPFLTSNKYKSVPFPKKIIEKDHFCRSELIQENPYPSKGLSKSMTKFSFTGRSRIGKKLESYSSSSSENLPQAINFDMRTTKFKDDMVLTSSPSQKIYLLKMIANIKNSALDLDSCLVSDHNSQSSADQPSNAGASREFPPEKVHPPSSLQLSLQRSSLTMLEGKCGAGFPYKQAAILPVALASKKSEQESSQHASRHHRSGEEWPGNTSQSNRGHQSLASNTIKFIIDSDRD